MSAFDAVLRANSQSSSADGSISSPRASFDEPDGELIGRVRDEEFVEIVANLPNVGDDLISDDEMDDIDDSSTDCNVTPTKKKRKRDTDDDDSDFEVEDSPQSKKRRNHRTHSPVSNAGSMTKKSSGGQKPRFLQGVLAICQNKPEALRWNSAGNGIEIVDHQGLQEELGKYFKHSSLVSFTRQLYNYGFRKDKSVYADEGLDTYRHEYFLKTKPELLSRIIRKDSSSLPISPTSPTGSLKQGVIVIPRDSSSSRRMSPALASKLARELNRVKESLESLSNLRWILTDEEFQRIKTSVLAKI